MQNAKCKTQNGFEATVRSGAHSPSLGSTIYRLLSTSYLLAATPLAVAAEPIAEAWDYAPAMREVVARSQGKPGVVLHIGDSMTYSNPYGQWARMGAGKTADDKAVLEWMHTGTDNELDGWWLCRFDHPDGGRSYTAAGGLRLDELLAGGKQGLPSLAEMLDHYRPSAIVLMIGTNDATAGRSPKQFESELATAVKLALDRAIVPILSTIPPHHARRQLASQLNASIREVARRHKLPLIDLEREILARRPDDWNGTLLVKNDVHLSATHGEQDQPGAVNSASEPSDENLRRVGYLLRGWLSVRKLAEVKHRVFDGLARRPASQSKAKSKTPAGESLRIDITRDTWFSNVGQEANGSNGGADRLKVKSIQEMSLVDFDPAPLRGRMVRSATLHLKPRSPETLKRMTIGSFSAEWTEGTASGYQPEPGSSCFNWRHFPGVPWAYSQSDLCEVILGRGGSRWKTADASPPGEGGWQTVAVDPHVVAARIAGCSYGLFVFDDTGSEWSRDGDRFMLHHFPNRFLHSRESGAKNAPYLTVELGERDEQPPAAPSEVQVETKGLPPGEVRVSWMTPKDEGPGETIGFHARLNGEPLPQYLLPPAKVAGQRVTMHVRDVPFADGAELSLSAVDSAGNEGPAAGARLRVGQKPQPILPPRAPAPREATIPLPEFAGAEVAIIDPLDKVAPSAKKLVPEQPHSYLSTNHLWNAEAREIHLHAAKNEFVGFQIWLMRYAVPDMLLTTSFADGNNSFQIEWSRLYPIRAGVEEICDAACPLRSKAVNGAPEVAIDQRPPNWPTGLTNDSFLSASGGALLCELYVPHDAKAGQYKGEVVLSKRKSKQELRLKLLLTVWDFTLPDHLSFLPEMNCYGLPENERDYYRLAHRHRTFLNRVPYHQNGSVTEGCAPVWDGKRLDWKAWDRRFGPYLDGSAFADLPRQGVPIEGFYLPWHENWPSPMEGNYNGDYWADRAFPESYRQALVQVARQTAEHFNDRGWHDTLFQGFLNNKNNFKEQGWFRGSSPWLLDEPANFQDYWALAWFGQAFHEGVNAVRGKAKLLYRCDISRPQWQRELLDDVLDYNVVGGAMRRYRRTVLDRKETTGQMVIEYGSANAIDQSNVHPAAWCIDAWSLGADGVLPWQTIGNDQSWEKSDTLALFYPGKPAGYDQPIASLRLKAFCRGQQDVEYLTLFSQLKQAPRWQIGQEVREWLGLAGQRRSSGVPAAEDAGVIHYGDIKPQDLWALRVSIGEALSAAHLPAQRRLVEFNLPKRSVRPLREFMVE